MIERARRKIATQGLFALIATTTLLAGCGDKKTAASNVVEMRDMEVVDGTINDAMTDLDAVSASGTGAGNDTGNISAAKKIAPAPDENPKDAEAVPSE